MILPTMGHFTTFLNALGHPRLLAFLCTILIPASAFLIAQQSVANHRIAELEATLDRDTHLAIGSRVGPLTGFSLDGERSELPLGSSNRGALIFGVSNSCPYCFAELDAHRGLSEQASAGGLDVYWVVRDTLRVAQDGAYTKAGLRGTFIVEPVNATYRAVGLGFVPQTLVVNASGEIDDTWRGVLGDAGQAKIREAIRRTSLRGADVQR